MIDYVLHGVLPTLTEVGVSCLLVGLGLCIFFAAIKACWLLVATNACIVWVVIFWIAWSLNGPFSAWWFVIATVLLSLNLAFSEVMMLQYEKVQSAVDDYGDHNGERFLAVCLTLMTGGTVAYHVYAVAPRPLVFCPDEKFQKARTGNLLTENFIPLRAVARLPNVLLYESDDVEDLKGVKGIMRPWLPYYVFEQRDGVIQIAESSHTRNPERLWISEAEAFCWTTRECINVEEPTAVYSREEDVASRVNPLEEGYTYRFGKHSKLGFEMQCLPILKRKDNIWAFVRPEGSARFGYQVAWLEWSNTSSAEVRIRVTRTEMDEYIMGLQRLLIDYTGPLELRARAKADIYGHGLAWITDSEDDRKNGGFQLINSQRKGIPKLYGIIKNPPDNDLQVEKIKEDLTTLLRYQLTANNWNADDVAFPLLSELP